MKNLFISIVIVFFTVMFLVLSSVAIGADDAFVGFIVVVLLVTYFFLFCGHLYELIKERNPLYTLSRGTKPGSFIGRISSLASRKKQYQKILDIYENEIRELINSSVDLIITEHNSKQKDLQEAIDANKEKIEKNEIEIEKQKKDKDNMILELMDAKKELIKKVEASEKSKRQKIDELKKNISEEKNLFKELQSRHTLIAKWVKNR